MLAMMMQTSSAMIVDIRESKKDMMVAHNLAEDGMEKRKAS